MSGVSPPLAPHTDRSADLAKFACAARRALPAPRPKHGAADERSLHDDERLPLGFLAFAARRNSGHRDIPRHIAQRPGDVG